ncbi:MAG: hypothetical protein EOP04_33905 [Proteobacteria bacterium]|nr:MAG: hypothetical protein EOP04_33905 [Pseudomonadota bacterium]
MRLKLLIVTCVAVATVAAALILSKSRLKKSTVLINQNVNIADFGNLKNVNLLATETVSNNHFYYDFSFFFDEESSIPITGQRYVISSDSIPLANFSVESSNQHRSVEIKFDAPGLYPQGTHISGRILQGEQQWKLIHPDGMISPFDPLERPPEELDSQ